MPVGARKALWAHLRACGECRLRFGRCLGSIRALRRLATPAGPAPEFFARLQRDTLRALAALPGRRPRRRGRALLAAACLLASGLAAHLAVREAPRGTVLSQLPAHSVPGTHPRAGMVVPVSFTPSRQGLRGLQQLAPDPFERAPRVATR